MRAISRQAMLAGAAALAALVAPPALADVKRGVDAWSKGDYAEAVREWQGPASAGDPDAMFNLAQAYRLGRGVPTDAKRAESLYARAAAAGHLQAADTYGLMLFQDGRREAALPYVEAAAKRGDPRSQYLLGIAYFNGDIVTKDWVKAYALLTQANGQGLPQAGAALAQMDEFIPLEQRQKAAALAVQMQREANSERGRALATADLDAGVAAPIAAQAPVQPRQVASATPAPPRPVSTGAVSPSVSAARAAVAEARAATGTEDPAEAGASFARPRAAATAERVAAAQPAPARTAPTPPRSASVTASASGPWKLQLGAFGVEGNAERLWAQLSSRSEIAGKQRQLVPAGRVTKLLAAGYSSRMAADDACRSLKRSGQDCIVTR